MTEPTHPLFEDEREFLERKKQEYERALRGDVDHLKDQGTRVGKVALVGAGLAGGIWLISKAFGGKKKKKEYDLDDDFDEDDDFFNDGYQYQDDEPAQPQERDYDNYDGRPRSAWQSAQAFMHHDGADTTPEHDYSFGAGAPGYATPANEQGTPGAATRGPRLDRGPELPLLDSYAARPYDDSRRLPESTEFDDEDEDLTEGYQPRAYRHRSTLGNRLGGVVKGFLDTGVGKAIAAQAAAVALAYVTKKVNDYLPASKNSDLAASPADFLPSAGAPEPTLVAQLSSPDALNQPLA